MALPCARLKIPSVCGFHVTTLCSRVVVTGNIFMRSFWMIVLKNDYLHILWSMLCDILEFFVEAVVLDVTVAYNLETWKPYYASSLGMINMQFCMKWIYNGERLCLKTISVLYQQMARYCKEQRFKVFCICISSRETQLCLQSLLWGWRCRDFIFSYTRQFWKLLQIFSSADMHVHDIKWKVSTKIIQYWHILHLETSKHDTVGWDKHTGR